MEKGSRIQRGQASKILSCHATRKNRYQAQASKTNAVKDWSAMLNTPSWQDQLADEVRAQSDQAMLKDYMQRLEATKINTSPNKSISDELLGLVVEREVQAVEVGIAITESVVSAYEDFRGGEWQKGLDELGSVGTGAAAVLALKQVGLFAKGPKSMVESEAANHINALRLQRSLTSDQAKSIFNESGGLTSEVIQKSAPLPIGQLRNPKLIEELSARPGNLSDWAKYTTESIPSPSGNFQMHFYRNAVTNDIYYGMDYKAVFDNQGLWNFEPLPNFTYEPPRFNP